ncbi:MAG: hypothetical protein GC136_00055 [Alphaproteobacteria bacterium]|nr:hypothetical protein [Alphaproteobacteria bacterium]
MAIEISQEDEALRAYRAARLKARADQIFNTPVSMQDIWEDQRQRGQKIFKKSGLAALVQSLDAHNVTYQVVPVVVNKCDGNIEDIMELKYLERLNYDGAPLSQGEVEYLERLAAFGRQDTVITLSSYPDLERAEAIDATPHCIKITINGEDGTITMKEDLSRKWVKELQESDIASSPRIDFVRDGINGALPTVITCGRVQDKLGYLANIFRGQQRMSVERLGEVLRAAYPDKCFVPRIPDPAIS